MEINKATEQKLGQLAEMVTDKLLEYFSHPGTFNTDLAKNAIATLSNCSKFNQTARAREGINLCIARDLAKDKNQLKKYVQISMPHLSVVKALK